MNCPKCGYVSFDHLDECKSCGQNLLEHKARLGIKSFKRRDPSPLVQGPDSPQELLPAGHNETAIETEPAETEMPEDDVFSIDDISFEEGLGEIETCEAPGIDIDISDIEGEESDENDDSDTEEGPFFEELGDAFVREENKEGPGTRIEDTAGQELEEDSAIGDTLQMPLAFAERSEVPEIEEGLDGDETGQQDTAPLVGKTVFLKRGLAFGLDWAILLGTLCVFIYLGLFILKSKALISTASLTMGIITTKLPVPIIFLTLVVSAAYFSFFHGTTGQTPGKMLFGLKVVGQDDEAVSVEKAFLRWFGYIVSALPLMGGFLMALKDRNGQALHDKIADTLVIAVSPQTVIEEEAGRLPAEEIKS